MNQHAAAPSASHGEQEPLPGRWVAMATLLIASFMNLIDVTIVNVALPSMQKSLNATSSQIEWVVAIYIMVFGLGLLPFGRLGDIVGRRRIFITGIIVFTIGSALCGLAPSINTLILARFLQGIGGAMMIPQTLAMVPAILSPSERAFAFSLFGLSAGLASVSGPIVGGLLIDANIHGLDWRPIFLVNIPVGIIAVFASLRFIPMLKGNPENRNDFPGILLAAISLFLLIFPLLEGRQYGWPLWAFLMMASSVLVMIAFVLWLRYRDRTGGPQVLPLNLLRNRSYMIGSAMTAFLFSSMPGFFLILAVYLQSGYGLTPLQSGITTVPFPAGVLIASLISGRLGARFPRRRITFGALMMMVTVLWLQHVIGNVEGEIIWTHFAPPLFLGGLGLGTAISPMFQTVLANVQGRDIGSGSGALQSFQQLGGAIGVAVIAEIFFSHVETGMAGGGDRHTVFAQAFTMAVYYNLAALFMVAALVRLLPKPSQVAKSHSGPSVEI